MSARCLGSYLLRFTILTAATASACGAETDGDRPSRPGDTGGVGPTAGGSSGSGGSTGGSGAVGGQDAAGAAGSSGSQAGGAGGSNTGGSGTGGASGSAGGPDGGIPETCGNGVADGTEDCDGDSFAAGVDCATFGFDQGELACNDDCSANTDGCSGTEDCYDGRDNDGDSLADCEDADDCTDDCADPCANVPVLDDPGSVAGLTNGSGNLSHASCSSAESGPERAYQVTASSTGMLDLELGTYQLLTLSVRTTCADPGTELGCSDRRLSLPVTAGDTWYVVVEGMSDADAGEFTLEAMSRPPAVCGDGFIDAGEQCEDENTDPGDGCDATCQLEATESEPNDTVADADPLQEPYYGMISPAGDVDVIAVEVTAAPASMRVNTDNVGIGMCALEMMDSYLEVLDTDQAGNGVVAWDDDGGDGLCARVSTFALPAGTYYIVVRASDYALPETAAFPYQLGVSVDQCGNGIIAAGEQCDDGNTATGDGCSSVCRLE